MAHKKPTVVNTQQFVPTFFQEQRRQSTETSKKSSEVILSISFCLY